MRLIVLMLFMVLVITPINAQTPTQTVPEQSMRPVEIGTKWLHVLNAPDQFLQLKLVCAFRGDRVPEKGPIVLQIELMSQSTRYRYLSNPELIATADGVEVRIGKIRKHPTQVILEAEKPRQSVTLNKISPVPAVAAILSQHKIKNLYPEWLITDVSWPALLTLAKASRIGWRLGETDFLLNESQVAEVKKFVTVVTPGTKVVAREAPEVEQRITTTPRKDTPSEVNNSSLKDTLDWLRRQITKYASDISPVGERESLMLSKFSSCNIEVRIEPYIPLDVTAGMRAARRAYVRPTLFYVFNLKDLDPEAVEMFRSGDRFWLKLSTTNGKESIRQIFKDNNSPPRESYPDQDASSFTLWLKKNDLAGDFTTATSYAIRLCRADPTR